jgi:phosphatidylinositol kinase/protein kinase (PI-3  family)
MQKGSLVAIFSTSHALVTSWIDSALPCFAAFGEQTANQLRDRFQPALTHSLVGDYVNGLIDSSLGSSWTRLYDSVSFFTSVLYTSS